MNSAIRGKLKSTKVTRFNSGIFIETNLQPRNSSREKNLQNMIPNLFLIISCSEKEKVAQVTHSFSDRRLPALGRYLRFYPTQLRILKPR